MAVWDVQCSLSAFYYLCTCADSSGTKKMTSIERAKQLADKAYSDYIGLESILRQDAQLYATIALAEAIERLTVALERTEGAKVTNND